MMTMTMNRFARVFAVVLLSYSNAANLRSKSDESTSENRALKEKPLPVMHTFYTRIDPDKHHKYTGMTDEADAKLLLTWKAAWRSAGWEPKILTLEDAQSHPLYEEFDERLDLDVVPFGQYDKLCFMRWLAMAVAGGGWMSDYDTFPLRGLKNTNPRHHGKLTLYDTVRAGGVPSVVSGSAEEYTRIARQMLENTLTKGIKEEFWSDMLSLMDLYQNDHNVFIVKDEVLKGERALEGSGKFETRRDCNMMVGGNWAVHFSHNAITRALSFGLLPPDESARDRPRVANEWLKEWGDKCKDIQQQKFVPLV